jgi:hypothetical protein
MTACALHRAAEFVEARSCAVAGVEPDDPGTAPVRRPAEESMRAALLGTDMEVECVGEVLGALVEFLVRGVESGANEFEAMQSALFHAVLIGYHAHRLESEAPGV